MTPTDRMGIAIRDALNLLDSIEMEPHLPIEIGEIDDTDPSNLTVKLENGDVFTIRIIRTA
jgi:hypothetical protein